jgi:hypothetical protein
MREPSSRSIPIVSSTWSACWNFRHEVLRRLLHGKQSLPSERPAHPHFPELTIALTQFNERFGSLPAIEQI